MERLSIDEAIAHTREVAKKNRTLAESDDLVRNSYSAGLGEKQCLLCAEEHEQLAEWLEELKEYRRQDEQGLLPKLPCSIGSDVYFIPSKVNFDLNKLYQLEESNRVYHQKIAKIVFTERGWYLECDKDLEYGTDHILVDKFYKETWFLSQAEAEDALRRLE